MKLFLDSADIEDVRTAVQLGFVDGVTMNPSLLARCGVRLEDVLPQICALLDGPVSAPVRATETEAIVVEGRRWARVHDNVVVKIPIDEAGLGAMARLHSEGIRIHATLCCSTGQALLAARCGADWLSPVVGRLDESGVPGLETVSHILEIYDNYEFDTQVMVASVRSTQHVQEAARLGTDACTLSLDLLRELAHHPLSQTLKNGFLADWERS